MLRNARVSLTRFSKSMAFLFICFTSRTFRHLWSKTTSILVSRNQNAQLKMCDCGDTGTGKYFSTIAASAGDKAERWGLDMMSQAGKRFKTWSGLGDYHVQYNSLINPKGGNGNPHVFTQGRGTTVRYREYLGDITVHPTVPGAFHVTQFKLQPGNVNTFPWLAPIAVQFDQYIIQGCIFEFKTTTTDATTNSAIGSVIASTFYDVDDPSPVSKAGMLNSAYSSESKMSEDMMHGIECEPSELSRNVYYTRPAGGAQAANNDISDYDVANFYIATQGGSLTAATIIGSLYVHYEFTFLKERPSGGIPSRDRLFATFLKEGMVAGDTTTLDAFSTATQTSGVDLGITFGSGAITIPRKWAGAVFVVRANCQFYTVDGVSLARTGAVYTNCALHFVNIPDSIGASGEIWAAPNGAGVSAKAFAWTLAFQIADVPSADANVVPTGGQMGTMPLVVPVGATGALWMEIMMVPKSWGLSLTN